jgi:lysyl-tRNA synthetase class 1
MPLLARLVEYALAYYRDFVRPKKEYRQPDAIERAALEDLAAGLRGVAEDAGAENAGAEDIQTLLYDIGKRHAFAELRAWFGCLYQVLLGQNEGPRFGQFIALYGVKETVALIEQSLARTEG